MAKTDAIQTDYFTDFRKLIDDDKEEETPITEEKQISYMGKTPGWKHVETYINELISYLDSPAQQAMETGCSYDEIGRKTIVAQLTKEFLGKVLEKVNDAKEATDNSKV